jgi:hypothetical protein
VLLYVLKTSPQETQGTTVDCTEFSEMNENKGQVKTSSWGVGVDFNQDMGKEKRVKISFN